jgi:hypothetical protein
LAGARDPAKQPAGVGGAMRPLMIINGFRFALSRPFSRERRSESGG